MMRLPNQSKPVARTVSSRTVADGVTPSWDCNLCNFLPEPAKTVCKLACSIT